MVQFRVILGGIYLVCTLSIKHTCGSFSSPFYNINVAADRWSLVGRHTAYRLQGWSSGGGGGGGGGHGEGPIFFGGHWGLSWLDDAKGHSISSFPLVVGKSHVTLRPECSDWPMFRRSREWYHFARALFTMVQSERVTPGPTVTDFTQHYSSQRAFSPLHYTKHKWAVSPDHSFTITVQLLLSAPLSLGFYFRYDNGLAGLTRSGINFCSCTLGYHSLPIVCGAAKHRPVLNSNF